MDMMKIYDLIIVGAGPAGITAGIYAKNFGLDCLIVGEEGGSVLSGAYKVDNYPGVFSLTGKDLLKKFREHQKHLKIPVKNERVEILSRTKSGFRVATDVREYEAKALIIAFGTQVNKPSIQNAEKLENKGVYYQTCSSASLFTNKTVAIIGGANSAVMRTIMCAGKAKKIYLIYRKNKLRADKIWTDKIKKFKNIEIIFNSIVLEVGGKSKLEKIILNNGKELKIDTLFVEAGSVPNIELIKDLKINTNGSGYIETEKNQSTSAEGVFAAGDITTGSNNFRQIVTACSEGAIAALGALNYLNKK
jgi:thioredoxin reductase (NADPH)